ncbi:putative DNA-binding protein [Staphylococcus carnosus]|nr:putative DNA-binding protein [Staphylococcus carnosus]
MRTDRRRRKSQAAIQNAFLNLLGEETFETLTIQK